MIPLPLIFGFYGLWSSHPSLASSRQNPSKMEDAFGLFWQLVLLFRMIQILSFASDRFWIIWICCITEKIFHATNVVFLLFFCRVIQAILISKLFEAAHWLAVARGHEKMSCELGWSFHEGCSWVLFDELKYSDSNTYSVPQRIQQLSASNRAAQLNDRYDDLRNDYNFYKLVHRHPCRSTSSFSA